jgi:hypothetical protein
MWLATSHLLRNSGTGYEFAPEACDVVSQERLIAYRSKRAEWLRLLDGDPQDFIQSRPLPPPAKYGGT